MTEIQMTKTLKTIKKIQRNGQESCTNSNDKELFACNPESVSLEVPDTLKAALRACNKVLAANPVSKEAYLEAKEVYSKVKQACNEARRVYS